MSLAAQSKNKEAEATQAKMKSQMSAGDMQQAETFLADIPNFIAYYKDL
jgi:hypothetical protein